MNIAFDNIANARDLGGLKCSSGTIREGLLLRGAHLGLASDADIARLQAMNLCKVIDFRTSFEVGGMPDRDVPGAVNIHLEATRFDNPAGIEMGRVFSTVHPFQEAMTQFILSDAGKQMCDGFYDGPVLSDYTQKAYARFLDEVSTADGAVFWHCTQGKDRTGLGAAFLLSALGADEETVLADYDLTNERYRDDIETISQMVIERGGGHVELQCVRTLVGVNTDLFRQALRTIDKTYGSMRNYLSGPLGMSEQAIQTLRSKYLI